MLASAYFHRSSRKRETVLRQLVLRALEWQTFSDLGNDCEMTKQASLFAKMTRILAFMAMFCTQGKNNSKKSIFHIFKCLFLATNFLFGKQKMPSIFVLNVTFNGFHEVPLEKSHFKKQKEQKWKQISNTLEVLESLHLFEFSVKNVCLFFHACVWRKKERTFLKSWM